MNQVTGSAYRQKLKHSKDIRLNALLVGEHVDKFERLRGLVGDGSQVSTVRAAIDLANWVVEQYGNGGLWLDGGQTRVVLPFMKEPDGERRGNSRSSEAGSKAVTESVDNPSNL